MSRLLLSLTLALALCVAAASAFPIRRSHVGALNQRLTVAERTQKSSGAIQPQYFQQKLDHEDLSSSVTFTQKYYVNDTFFNPSFPLVFLSIGGEGAISPAYVLGHFITNQYAQEHSALLVALEHRFYGESIPAGNSSTESLKYLSSAQALEDLVTFHEQITSQYGFPAGVPWFVFGGSYSGNLAAWARLKYPNLFFGSFAASAPVQAELDFGQYFQVVSNSVQPTCSNVIQAANNEVYAQLNTTQGLSALATDFNLCAPPATSEDIATFLGDLSGPIAGVVQYNDDNNKYQPYDIPTMCNLLESPSDPLQGLLAVWNSYNNFTGQGSQCTDASYAGFIASMQGTSDGRSWTWQTCTEFGYFQTGDAPNQPFSNLISLESFVQSCQDIFGIQGLTPNIEWINDFYGGNQIVTSNTIFTNGDVDPWHVLGNYQTYQPNSGSASILIQGTAHCADLYPPRDQDLPGLVAARQVQAKILSQWIGEVKAKQAKPVLIALE